MKYLAIDRDGKRENSCLLEEKKNVAQADYLLHWQLPICWGTVLLQLIAEPYENTCHTYNN